jgi:hypothetical protein
LLQSANGQYKKAGSDGLTFGGTGSKTNLIRKTVSGHIDLPLLGLTKGVYFCTVSCGAGHMFVLHVVSPTDFRVYDSIEGRRQNLSEVDFSWVIRWISIRKVFRGHF